MFYYICKSGIYSEVDKATYDSYILDKTVNIGIVNCGFKIINGKMVNTNG